MEIAPVRVVLAESSPLSHKILERMLEGNTSISVVATTRSGREALSLVEELRPDVLCIATRLTDLPSLELTREVMARLPLPILVMGERALPGSAKAPDAETAFALLEAGAVDVWIKPRAVAISGDLETGDLITKIKRLSRVPVISRPLKNRDATKIDAGKIDAAKIDAAKIEVPLPPATGKSVAVPFPHLETGAKSGVRVVLIGASTGGPQALVSVLSGFPRDFPVPVLCVQHISKGFLNELVVWLDRQCNLAVQIAKEGEMAAPGHVYFPHENEHLEIDGRGRLHLSGLPPRDGHRPSVTVTFESGARAFGSGVVAALLTGMGGDGAMGLRAVRLAGGTTLAQSEASCVVFGMPKVAIELGAAQHVLAPAEISRKIVSLVTA
jgi:two-component system chemotaxis response regulator CheB